MYVIFIDLIHKLDQIHGLTMVLGLMTIATLGLFKRYAPKIPRAFTVVVLAIGVVILGELEQRVCSWLEIYHRVYLHIHHLG